MITSSELQMFKCFNSEYNKYLYIYVYTQTYINPHKQNFWGGPQGILKVSRGPETKNFENCSQRIVLKVKCASLM